MLRKTITFPNLDGEMLTEDFYFNLTGAEIAEMELSQEGGFSEFLKSIVETGDAKIIIETFKNIIKQSYGVRSEDGRRFIKTPELWDEFLQTEAYSVLFLELVTDADASAAFIRGIVPKNLEEQIQFNVAAAATARAKPQDHLVKRGANIHEVRPINDVELPGLTEEEQLQARLDEIRAAQD